MFKINTSSDAGLNPNIVQETLLRFEEKTLSLKQRFSIFHFVRIFEVVKKVVFRIEISCNSTAYAAFLFRTYGRGYVIPGLGLGKAC